MVNLLVTNELVRESMLAVQAHCSEVGLVMSSPDIRAASEMLSDSAARELDAFGSP